MLARLFDVAAPVCDGERILAVKRVPDLFTNGRRAVTHWQDAPPLAPPHHYKLQDDAIFVHDGKFYTSAGITAGMDLLGALSPD